MNPTLTSDVPDDLIKIKDYFEIMKSKMILSQEQQKKSMEEDRKRFEKLEELLSAYIAKTQEKTCGEIGVQTEDISRNASNREPAATNASIPSTSTVGNNVNQLPVDHSNSQNSVSHRSTQSSVSNRRTQNSIRSRSSRDSILDRQDDDNLTMTGTVSTFDENETIPDDDSQSSYIPSESTNTQTTSSVVTNNLPKVDWQLACQRLLNGIWDKEESGPFQLPVDETEYEDYRQCITTPMCLNDVKETMSAGDYKNPREFKKDMDLIWENSRKYNNDKKTQIYKQTTTLKVYYEDRIDGIISDWKRTRGSSKKTTRQKRRPVGNRITEQSSQSKRRRVSIDDEGTSGRNDEEYSENGTSTSSFPTRKSLRNKNKKKTIDDYEDDDLENFIEDDGDESSSGSDADSGSEESEREADLRNTPRRSSRKKAQDSSDAEDCDEVEAGKIIPSTTQELRNITAGQKYVTIKGRVREAITVERYVKSMKKDVDLFTCIIDNENGVSVYCVAWEDNAVRMEHKLQNGTVVCIDNAEAKSRSDFAGRTTAPYEIVLKEYTTVKWSR